MAVPLPDPEKLTPAEVQAILRTIRERQAELDAAQERYRSLFDSAPVGYLTLDMESRIVEANRAMAELCGVARTKLIGRDFASMIAPAAREGWEHLWRGLQRSKHPRGLEVDLQRADGEALHAEIVGSAGEGGAGKAETIRLAVLDVTELRATERALRVAASQATLAEQEERRRLAVDLHDDVGQTLSLASMKLRHLAQAGDAEQEKAYREVARLLAEARERISSLSFQLSPPILYDLGLVAAGEWLAEDIERRYGLQVAIDQEGEPEMDEATRVTLYRALRELLINVAKHSGVHEAHVRFWKEGAWTCMQVTDGGRGFEPREARRGFGLLALRERVSHLGGTVKISSAEGSGARVLICVPGLGQSGDAAGGSES